MTALVEGMVPQHRPLVHYLIGKAPGYSILLESRAVG